MAVLASAMAPRFCLPEEDPFLLLECTLSSSIRQGFRELAYDINGMLALGGVTSAGSAT